MNRPLTTAVVVLFAVYTTVWGFWVGNPFWTVFTQADLFAAMSRLAPEPVWGCAAMLGGAVALLGVKYKSYLWKRWGVGIMTWHWLLVSIFYFIGDWHNTGGITGLFFLAYGAYIFVKLKLGHEFNEL